jgi:hypothetical protein
MRQKKPRSSTYEPRRFPSLTGNKTRAQRVIAFLEFLPITKGIYRIKATSFWKRMEVRAGPGKGTVYAVLSGEKEAAHGLAPSLWIFDELGIAPNRQLLDALQTASGRDSAIPLS